MTRREWNRRGTHASGAGFVGPAGGALVRSLALLLALGILSLGGLAGCTNPLLPIIKALTSSPEAEPDPEPPAPAPTYAVTYHGSGNTGGSVPVDPARYEQGSTVTVQGNTGSLVKNGYAFGSWNTQPDGSGLAYAAGETFTIGTAGVILYAVWTRGPGVKETFVAGSVSFALAYAPAKAFPTGTDDAGTSAVTRPFWVGETEVTWPLWKAAYDWATDPARGSGRYYFQNTGRRGSVADGTGMTDQHPVTMISWRDVLVWSNAATEWYNAATGTSYTCPYRHAGQIIRDSRDANASACDTAVADEQATGFRLLASEEWELAARYRGDDTTNAVLWDGVHWTKGDSASGATAAYSYPIPTQMVAWYDANSGRTTQPVGQKQPNTLGLHDMSGNVKEWCFTLRTDPGITRIVRGGGWDALGPALRVGVAPWDSPYRVEEVIGFRLARTE